MADERKPPRGARRAPDSITVAGDAVGGDKFETHHHHAGATAPTTTWQPNASLRRYLAWLETQPTGVSLRGVGGADIELQLDEVYVPLQLKQAFHLEEIITKGLTGTQISGLEFELEELFARLRSCPHALLLGDPGSGKTTALRKLSQRAVQQIQHARGRFDGEPTTIHLPARTVPVFVRLRSITREDLDRPLRAFVTRELADVSKDIDAPLDAAVTKALWRHREVLLLLDGLDEIADHDLRAAVCRYLDKQLRTNACRGLRVVVTSRFTGYDGKRVRLSPELFARVELRPLSHKQARLLVTRWFLEAARRLDNFSQSEAQQRADHLADALADPRFDRHRRAMYATPLILTLLCVVVQRGCEMPKKRAEFYDTCLKVLLERWELAKDHAVNLSAEAAIDLLRPIAYDIHCSGKREQLDKDSFLEQLCERLDVLGLETASDFEAVFEWLHQRAAVLSELAPGEFGFFHLGVQEYLAALHVASEGPRLVDALAAAFDESWWEEVALLAVSIPRLGAFARLMDQVLDGPALLDTDGWTRLRQCVLEAHFDPAPFVDRLTRTPLLPPTRLLALLRLVRGVRDRRLGDAARTLAERSDDVHVQGAARQFVGDFERSSERATPCDITVLGLAADRASVAELLARLRATALRVWPEEGATAPLEDKPWKAVSEAVERVVIVVGATAPWSVAPARTCLRLLHGKGREIVGVLGPEAAAPDDTPGTISKWLDMRAGWDVAALGAGENAPAIELLDDEFEPVIDLLPDLRLVRVPGGRFKMGSDDISSDERPPHWVHVSPFWIGQTPVTNRQYRVFVENTGHNEPRYWNDRKFNDPDQPVVGVSWDDAMAFCQWLRAQTGWAFDLPSEAQWEFAARGTDGRRYAWGDEAPDSTRGCVGKGADGQPAVVGSYPAGEGPFGTLDQGGNVWEWCKDVWDEAAYRKRSALPKEQIDPCVVEGANESWRSIRGTSWFDDAALAAAVRRRLDRRFWVVCYGFRVLVSREPVVP